MSEFMDLLQFCNSTTLLVFFLTFIVIFVHTRRRHGIPPGPACWPIVGNIFSLIGKDTLEQFSGFRRRYGDIYSLYVGQEIVTVLNGYECIHDALVKQGSTFAWRPIKIGLKNVSIIFENGKTWKDNRAFVAKVFHDLCFGKADVLLEDRILKELSFLIKHFETISTPVDISHTITYSLANIMFSIIHGQRTDYENKRLTWYLNKQKQTVKSFALKQIICHCLPFLERLPGDLFQLKYTKLVKELKEHFCKVCEATVKQYEEDKENCLIDYCITSIRNDHELPDTVTLVDKVWSMLHDLMGAGSETTASTIKWILYFLIKQPDIQEKLRKEIDAKIGMRNLPSYKSRKEMPYVEATILEALRIGSIVPLSVPHTVRQDFVFRGYLIPENSTVLPNLSSVHMDPSVFTNPEIFKPERFLSADGSRVHASEKLIPFSLGPRSCMGETIARIELFLYLTTLIQNFEFKNPDGQDLSSVRGILTLTYCPDIYKILILKRQTLKTIH